MISARTALPLDWLDRYWSNELGNAPADLRAGTLRLVPSAQTQVHVLVTPDGAAIIGLPQLIEPGTQAGPTERLQPSFWADKWKVPLNQLTFYGPGSLSYVTEASFKPATRPEVNLLRRADDVLHGQTQGS